MAEWTYSRRARGDVALPYPPPRIEAEVMDGRWLKTNEKPQWIDSLEVETVDGETFVHIRGSAPPSPADWGRVRCESVYANAPDTSSALAGGFIAHYDFDDMHVEVQANYNLGLLVVATFVEFKERTTGFSPSMDEGRAEARPTSLADRFTREFFYRG